MTSIGSIICKGVGVAGVSAVLYDAFSVGKANSKRTAMAEQADHFERVIADTRTLTTESYINSGIQDKIRNQRLNSPIYSLTGSIKGAVVGFLNSLGDNLIPATLSAMALAGKGIFAKIGAWGTAGYAAFTLLREGFGVTKHSPMD